MEISVVLAKVFGFYFIVMALAMLLNPKGFRQNIRDLAEDSAAMTVAAIITLLLGILLVVIHNQWSWQWPVIITLLAWLTLIKGLLRFLIPSWTKRMTYTLSHNWVYIVFALMVLGLGLLLIYFGVIAQ